MFLYFNSNSISVQTKGPHTSDKELITEKLDPGQSVQEPLTLSLLPTCFLDGTSIVGVGHCFELILAHVLGPNGVIRFPFPTLRGGSHHSHAELHSPCYL